jgi:hypothetical protein
MHKRSCCRSAKKERFTEERQTIQASFVDRPRKQSKR